MTKNDVSYIFSLITSRKKIKILSVRCMGAAAVSKTSASGGF